MFHKHSDAFFTFLIVLCALQYTQGCSLICANGGTIMDLCSTCKCAPQWTGHNCSKPCGGTLSSFTGSIMSHGYPTSYRNNENCSWIVDVPPNFTVILSFKSLHLEKDHDFVYIYKGKTRNSELVGTYHGYEIPYEKIMEESFLIQFTSDNTINRKGFLLNWVTYRGLIPRFIDHRGDFVRVTIAKGKKVTFLCNVNGVPQPNILWTKDGILIAGSKKTFLTHNGNTLVVSHVNETDAGLYKCEAGNYLGSIQRSFQLLVHVPPVVTQTPTSIHFDYLFEDGQQAAFWCNVYGIPQPNVYWKMNGSIIEKSNRHFIMGRRWLLIRPVSYATLGKYSCYANNTVGHVESDAVTLSTGKAINNDCFRYLKFLHNPTANITMYQKFFIRLLWFFCSNELMDFRVYKEGVHINSSSDERVSEYYYRSEYAFNVSSIRMEDVGIYEIRDVGHNYSTFTVVDIQVPPTASITTTKNVLNTFDHKAAISCQSDVVYPKPSFVWYINGVDIIMTSNKHKIVNGYFKSYLILNCFSNNQSVGGVYACAAVNDAGKSTASINMTVRVTEGWIEFNEGSQCACGLEHGIKIVQRKCVRRGARCVGPSVYARKCQPQTGCPTYETKAATTTWISTKTDHTTTSIYTATVNTSQKSVNALDKRPTDDSKQTLSQSAAAGISVAVIFITAVFALALFFYIKWRRNKQKTPSLPSLSTTSPITNRSEAFRKIPQNNSTSTEETMSNKLSIRFQPVVTSETHSSGISEIEVLKRYSTPFNSQPVNVNLAYVATRAEQKVYEESCPIYEEAI